ncbi:MAG: hypothetical protein QM757_26530 [Paludibaculum sp.]
MWKCPECKSDSLDVEVTTWARLYQGEEDDNFQTEHSEAEDCSHEWGSSNSMRCRSCGHTAKAGEFDVDNPQGEGEPTMTLFQRLDRLQDLLRMDIYTVAPEYDDEVADVRELVGSIREAMDLLPTEEETEEPSQDDTVRCCPNCERPNQFGELCLSCQRESEAG